MAADWIKMRVDLQTHPKIVRILSVTKADKFRVIGGLHAVWSVFDTHSTDGVLRGYTPELMDHVIGWEGFTRAMESVGWLTFDGLETLSLPEFTAHNGKSAKARAEDQKRKRDGRRSSEVGPELVRILSEENRTREREEREREEKQEQSASATADAPLRADPIPYQAIVDAYNTTMTKLPKVRELTAKRRTAIRKAWQESKTRQSLDFWLAYFEECESDNRRNGTGPYHGKWEDWRPDFDFLIRSDQVTKVYEAAMSRMERVA